MGWTDGPFARPTSAERERSEHAEGGGGRGREASLGGLRPPKKSPRLPFLLPDEAELQLVDHLPLLRVVDDDLPFARDLDHDFLALARRDGDRLVGLLAE